MSATAITLVRDHDTQAAGLVFVDQLPTRRPNGKYAALAAALKEQPGKYAVISTFPAIEKHLAWRFSNSINSGKYVDMREGFQARAISDGDTTRVYARYQPVVEVQS